MSEEGRPFGHLGHCPRAPWALVTFLGVSEATVTVTAHTSLSTCTAVTLLWPAQVHAGKSRRHYGHVCRSRIFPTPNAPMSTRTTEQSLPRGSGPRRDPVPTRPPRLSPPCGHAHWRCSAATGGHAHSRFVRRGAASPAASRLCAATVLSNVYLEKFQKTFAANSHKSTTEVPLRTFSGPCFSFV